ncbi:MAG: hypothetical protein HYT16_02355 [DPANN group archaeon]|nr:hypothetical protein [DPANN group archaeon]
MVKVLEAALKVTGVVLAALGIVLLIEPQNVGSIPSVSTAIYGIIIMAMGGFLFVISEK